MTEAEERQRIACARARLWASLSQGKYKGDPHTDTVEEIRPLSDVLRLNSARAQLRATLDRSRSTSAIEYDGCPDCQRAARSQLIKTMSGKAPSEEPLIEESTIEYRTAQGSKIASEVTPASIMKLNQARREIQGTMAGLSSAAAIALAKDNLIRTMQSSGIRSVAEDSNQTNTDSGIPFSGGFPINVTCRGKTLEQLLDDEDTDSDSPSPAVVSGQTGTADWSPDTAANGDYVSDQPFDAGKAKADLLAHYTSGKTGKISGYAKRYFLNVLSDASKPEHFMIPLGQVSVSQQPYYDSTALLEAWKHAAGIYNGAANRSLQLRLVRIMRRNGFTLIPEMQQFATNHMGEPAHDDDEDNQEE